MAALKLINFVPKTILAGKKFNVQPSGLSALWAETENATRSTVLTINHIVLDTLVANKGKLVTVFVPDMLYQSAGDFSVYLFDTKTGERSNILYLEVQDNPLSLESSTVMQGQHILIACMPKSGSTFLANCLISLTGFKNYPFLYAFGQNEQDIYLPYLNDAYSLNTISQQHVKATTTNLELMEKYSLKPVILVRNIFDIIASFYDHLHNESLEVPMCYLNARFFELDVQTRIDLIIDLVLPWYFSFYASWHDVKESRRVETIWFTYEEIMANKVASLTSILKFYNIKKEEQDILSVLNQVDKTSTRFNKGVVGRGFDFLTKTQRDKVFYYKRYYPRVDFSIIGI